MTSKYGATIAQSVLSIVFVLLALIDHERAIVVVVLASLSAIVWALKSDVTFADWAETVDAWGKDLESVARHDQ